MFARVCSANLFALFCLQPLWAVAADTGASVLDATSLRARVTAAEGTRPDQERLTETYTSHGIAGKTVVIRSGKNSRVDDGAGPFSSASGSYNGQQWHQNANGETVLEQPEQSGIDEESTTTSVRRVSQPIDAYVISTVNARGEGEKEYVDPVTYRLVRRERTSATDTTVTVFDDFRKTGGFVRPWHWTIRDGHPENDTEYRVVAAEVNVSDADVRIPPNRRILVEFPAGKTTVALPAREFEGQFIVRVQIGSRGYDFTLDTGASGIAMDDDAVRDIGLKAYGTYSSGINAGRYTGSRAIIPEMSVGELKMHDVVVHTIPHVGYGDNKVYKSVGLLGFDFIGDVALSLDYLNGRVSATTPEAFSPPKDRQAFEIPVRFGQGEPETEVAINGVPGERFFIDTGWGGANMAVFDYFARRHPEAMRGAVFLQNQPRFMGVGGEVAMTPYKFDTVKLGNIVFKDFIAYRVASTKAYSFGADGVIGVGFLQLFTIYTDYAHSTLYFVPNGRKDTGAS